ncbi:hypothetical protein [Actinomadura sp. NPDC048394]
MAEILTDVCRIEVSTGWATTASERAEAAVAEAGDVIEEAIVGARGAL